MQDEQKIREQIVHYGRLLSESGFVAATDGNISVRLNQTSLLLTPTCMPKRELQPEDLLVVDMEGRRLSGDRGVSSEVGMHLQI